MQVVLGSQPHEHCEEWVRSTRLRSLYIYPRFYLYIHTYLYILIHIVFIYISVKAGVLQKLALKKFYINMSQCLSILLGCKPSEKLRFPHTKKSFVFPQTSLKCRGSLCLQSRRGHGKEGPPSHSTAHLHLFASISIFIRFLRVARHGCLTKSTRCLLSGHAGEDV